MRALKYLMAFLLPLVTYWSFSQEGWKTFLPIIIAFLVIPFLESLLKPDSKNLNEIEEEVVRKDKLYDYVLYLSLPVQAFLLWSFLNKVAGGGYNYTELVGYTTGMGLMCGILGINIAHELGHRKTWYEQYMSKALLMSSLYMHFYIEHNRGHHKRVATPDDPASARYNESIYFFWPRSIVTSYFSAWKIELARLKKFNFSFFSVNNEMLWFHVIQGTLIWSIYQVYGGLALQCFLSAALMGILLLEMVNYIEHYGLVRKKYSSGRYEKVMHYHSWNSDYILGRLMLFELTRHSDHHFKASKPYQLLEHVENSPQMPTGYPGMMLLSLIPPVFFKMMNKRIKEIDLEIPELNPIQQ